MRACACVHACVLRVFMYGSVWVFVRVTFIAHFIEHKFVQVYIAWPKKKRIGWKEVEGYSLHLQPKTNVIERAGVCVYLNLYRISEFELGRNVTKQRQQRWQQQPQ